LADPNITSGQISQSFTNTDNKVEATYKTTITQGGHTDLFLLNGTFSGVDRNNYVYIWPSKVENSETDLFGGAKWNGSTKIYWGTDTSDSCKNAALEISVISGNYPLNKSNPVLTLTKYAYDPCDTRRTGATGNGFSQVVPNPLPPGSQKTIDNKTLLYMVNVPPSVSDSIYLIAITPLYVDNTFIGAQSDTSFPLQGKNAFSVGDVGGQVVRQAAAFKNLLQIPAELFPYTIFSP
jgi:hypothetical protein